MPQQRSFGIWPIEIASWRRTASRRPERAPRFSSARKRGREPREASEPLSCIQKALRHRRRRAYLFKLAAGLGLEPRKADSESAVIPFHHPASRVYFNRFPGIDKAV